MDEQYYRQQLRHHFSRRHGPQCPTIRGSRNFTKIFTKAHDCNEDICQLYRREKPPSDFTLPLSFRDGGSEDSGQSKKSIKTVVNKKSSRSLREMVKSQCKLQVVIDKTLKNMCTSSERLAGAVEGRYCKPLHHCTPPQLRMKFTPRQMIPTECDKLHSQCAQKFKGETESPARICNDCSEPKVKHPTMRCHMHNAKLNDPKLPAAKTETPLASIYKRPNAKPGDDFVTSIASDDIVSSKLIHPMLVKLQRVHLSNLTQKISLMEELERLPQALTKILKVEN